MSVAAGSVATQRAALLPELQIASGVDMRTELGHVLHWHSLKSHARTEIGSSASHHAALVEIGSKKKYSGQKLVQRRSSGHIPPERHLQGLLLDRSHSEPCWACLGHAEGTWTKRACRADADCGTRPGLEPQLHQFLSRAACKPNHQDRVFLCRPPAAGFWLEDLVSIAWELWAGCRWEQVKEQGMESVLPWKRRTPRPS
mmetsp:Transcript_536/g.1124  ORF Transcript_536/g.1124 Transcript_536/m.1124 type:complete len:200 (+) Transcript_536:1014-1613(+)